MQQETEQGGVGLTWIHRRLKQTGRGKHVGRFSYYHFSLADSVPGVLARFAEICRKVHGTTFQCNVVKLDPQRRISFLRYESFDAPFPILLASLSCDVEQATACFIDYSRRRNPPILHRKELLLPANDPRVVPAARLTERLEREGAFRNPSAIGTQDGWQRCLSRLGIDPMEAERPSP